MSSSKVGKRIAEICEPYGNQQYANIDLNRLATFAIDLLSENGIVPTFENLVVALFRLFPEKFSLPSFPEYPDAARVNRSLLQLRPKYRNWAVRSSAQGYVLTELGRRVARQTKDLLSSASKQGPRRRSVPSPPRTIYDGIARTLRNSSAFQKFVKGEGETVTRPEIFELMGAVPYTPTKILRSKLRDWSQLAEQAEDEEVREFLQWIDRNFSGIFHNRGEPQD